MSYAVLSCDLDGVGDHLRGYGFCDVAADDAVYTRAVPRLLDLLAALAVPAVVFVIARDAAAQRGALRRLAAAGVELASHSLTHPQPFRALDDAQLRSEIRLSRERLVDATGADVVGFRAPGWDADQRVIDALGEAGYRYDASSFPSPALLLARAATWWRSARAAPALTAASALWPAIEPHRRPCTGAPPLMEFPLAVTRRLRLPVYHTLAQLAPAAIFRHALASVLRSRRPLSYAFHAVDLLDIAGDGLDPRLARHPGMQAPLDQKLARLRQVLGAIARRRPILTYRQALAAEEAR